MPASPTTGLAAPGYLPKDLPPWRTVYGYFAAWRDNGTLQRLHDRLRDQARIAAGRDPRPTAAVIDSQSVKAADTVPKASRGWDNAKKVNGRKRHIAVDASGLLLAVVITAASVQHRDGARPLLWNLSRCCTRIRLAWADSGNSARKLAAPTRLITQSLSWSGNAGLCPHVMHRTGEPHPRRRRGFRADHDHRLSGVTPAWHWCLSVCARVLGWPDPGGDQGLPPGPIKGCYGRAAPLRGVIVIPVPNPPFATALA